MHRLPFPRSYWVDPGRLLAGFYPGSQNPDTMRANLDALLDCGIRCFINLMEPDETNHVGEPFVAYEPVVKELAAERALEVSCLNFPIRDQSVTTFEHMREIVSTLQHALDVQQTPVFVHCWGGKGRTGTVVGCWLASQGIVQGEAIFERIQELRQNDPQAHNSSPETSEQFDFVRQWSAGLAG